MYISNGSTNTLLEVLLLLTQPTLKSVSKSKGFKGHSLQLETAREFPMSDVPK